MKLQPVKMAIIGCGNISSIYLQNCTTWPILDVELTSTCDRPAPLPIELPERELDA